MRLAGQTIRLQVQYESFRSFAGDYLLPPETVKSQEDFSIIISDTDIAAEQTRSDQEAAAEGKTTRIWPPEYLETLAVYRKIAEKMPAFDTFLFHGSAVAVDGQAYLFTAKSGTGKSTHTRLWRQHFGDRCIMINDDKPLLHWQEEHFLVCGTPWDGKHHLSRNMAVPLKALCILTRDEYNHIEPISAEEAWPLLWQQVYRPADGEMFAQTLTLMDKLTKMIPLYRLGCNRQPEAAIISYEGMQQS